MLTFKFSHLLQDIAVDTLNSITRKRSRIGRAQTCDDGQLPFRDIDWDVMVPLKIGHLHDDLGSFRQQGQYTLVNDVQPVSQCVKPHDVCLFHDVVKFMSFVSEYNLGRDESTTYFLASLACSLRTPALWPVFTLPDRRAQAGGAYHKLDISFSTAWLTIILFAFHICQAFIANVCRLVLQL